MEPIAQEGKHLYVRGKTEMYYDYANDILFFKVKNREYEKSIELENLVVDVDKENFIVGIQIFDASDFFRLPKAALRNVKGWRFETRLEKDRIEIRLAFQVVLRNKRIEMNPIIRENLKEPIAGIEALTVTA